MYKFCNSCKTEKNIDDFSFKSKAKNTKHSKCKICHRIDSNKHYKKNAKHYTKIASEKKKLIREWWQNYKKQFKCACGESHPACIEFHHHEKNKEKDVSAFFNDGSSFFLGNKKQKQKNREIKNLCLKDKFEDYLAIA